MWAHFIRLRAIKLDLLVFWGARVDPFLVPTSADKLNIFSISLLFDSNRITALTFKVIFTAAFALAIRDCLSVSGELKEAVSILVSNTLATPEG